MVRGGAVGVVEAAAKGGLESGAVAGKISTNGGLYHTGGGGGSGGNHSSGGSKNAGCEDGDKSGSGEKARSHCCYRRGYRQDDCATKPSDFVSNRARCVGFGHDESTSKSDAVVLVVELPVSEKILPGYFRRAWQHNKAIVV